MEDQSPQDKQHEATGKRLMDLRRKGTVMRSRDLTGGLVLIGTILCIFSMLDVFKAHFQNNFVQSFTAAKQILIHEDLLSTVIRQLAFDNLFLMLPIFGVMLVAIIISPFIYGGWNFTLEAIEFKLEKLNPITNLMNIFNPKRAMGEVFRSMLKAFGILGVLIAFCYLKKEEIFSLNHYAPKTAIIASITIVEQFIVWLVITLIFLVIFDMVYHLFQFKTQNKMTTQEIKDEHKEMDGSVEMKRKIRSTQIAILKQRLTQTVPKANVVVTNPTHYAVALKYDERKDRAPKVIAKGKGLIAQQIRMLAISNGIPIYEAPPLARAVYHTTKVNAEIHSGLYMAVAIILSYVHQLKNYQMGKGQMPKHVSDLEIPKEFNFNE